MHATIAIAHARCADLLDASLETGLIGATRSVMVGGVTELEHTACASDRDIPLTANRTHQLALATRPQSFRRITLKHLAIKRQVGNNLLQLRVLIFKLLQPP